MTPVRSFAHGGGFIPYYSGRFDWMVRRGTSKGIKSDFSTYLRSFYYESVVFNPDVLERREGGYEPHHARH